MPDPAILRGSQICKAFGGIHALEDVSFNVEKGEIVGLVGPNGSGKTTLFNVLSGFMKPDSGEVYFKGEKVTGKPPERMSNFGVGRTFQLVRPFSNMTVLQNVLVPTLYRRNGPGSMVKAQQDSLRWLEYTGLATKVEVLAKSLTLPERRRLELARTLASEPEIVLLDEILAGLNPTEVNKGMELIKRVRTDLGIPVLIIEHNMKAVMNLSDRIFVLNRGRTIAEGTPSQVASMQAVQEVYMGKQ